MKHPLLNPESIHYHRPGRRSAIEEQESQMSLPACKGYARGNIIKYDYRLAFKGQKESDLKKLETYRDYLHWLLRFEDMVKESSTLSQIEKETLSVAELYKLFGIKMEYDI